MSFNSRIARAAALSTAAFAMTAALPAQAQFGGLLGSIGRSNTSSAATTAAQTCPNGKQKSVGASILGGVARSATSRIGGRFASFVPLPEFAELLTGAIACQLDNKEQKQAAEATIAATRGDEATGEVKVGDTAEWTSASRKDVKGKSTVIALEETPAGNGGGNGNAGGKGKGKGQQLAAGGARCITVSDVVIVNGEETTANKRMCKGPGQARYTLMA